MAFIDEGIAAELAADTGPGPYSPEAMADVAGYFPNYSSLTDLGGGALTTPVKIALGVGVVSLAVLLLWPGSHR